MIKWIIIFYGEGEPNMNAPSELNQANSFSTVLSDSIVKLFKAGQYGLVLVFIGVVLLVISKFAGDSIIGYTIGAIGALTILTVLYFFYVKDIQKLKQMNENIEKNMAVLFQLTAKRFMAFYIAVEEPFR